MNALRVVRTPRAPIPKVPSSQAFVVENFVFCSGQIAVDPATGELIDGGLKEQTARALENLSNVLQEAGASLTDVVKTTNYLVNLSQVSQFNEVYKQYFKKPFPPRTVIQVTGLARGALVEVDAIAVIHKN